MPEMIDKQKVKAVIVKLHGAWVGIYNFDSVFCVELNPV